MKPFLPAFLTKVDNFIAAEKVFASVFFGLVLLSGCRTAPPPISPDTLARIESSAQASIRTALVVDLTAFPQQRPLVVQSLQTLDAVIATGQITGVQLATIARGLTANSTTLLVVGGVLLAWDTVDLVWNNPNSPLAKMAAAKGISAGAHEALLLTQPSGVGTARLLHGAAVSSAASIPPLIAPTQPPVAPYIRRL